MRSTTTFVMLFAASIGQLIGATCPVAATVGYQPYSSDLGPMFNQAARNTLGTNGPTLPTIWSGYPNSVRVSPFIPKSIIKAVAWFEKAGWKQFNADYGQSGTTVISPDCGYGIMQITSGMDGSNSAFVPSRVAAEPAYNIGTGAQFLLTKWNQSQVIGNNNPNTYENWYYAIWAYNGYSDINNPSNPLFPDPFPVYNGSNRSKMPYQEGVWSLIRNPGAASAPPIPYAPLWEIVPITSPNRNLFTFPTTPAKIIATPSPGHIDADEPVITSSVQLTPAGPYSLNQTIQAQFMITNKGTTRVTFDVLTLGGRLNGDNTCSGGCPDFSFEMNIGIDPGQTHTYNGSQTMTRSGNYTFFTAYKIGQSWNTAIPTDPGIVNTAAFTISPLTCGTSTTMSALSLKAASTATPSAACSPLPPDTPNPPNGATNVSQTPTIGWSGGTSAPSYDLYLGPSTPPSFVATVNGTSYGPLSLNPGTTYYWYVVPRLTGATPSPTWSFTTASGPQPPGQPTNLTPANTATNVSATPLCSWNAASGATSYKVFFGPNNPPYFATTTTTSSFSPGQLGSNTTYYWRVEAVNATGSTSSPLTSFTTTTVPVSGPALVTGLTNPNGIALDATFVYWIEYGGQLVRKVPKTGGTPITLFATPYNPSGLAVDDVNVYFGDGLNIRSVPKNGGTSTVLATANPSHMAADASNLYWTDYSAGAIRKMAKSGGPITTLATGSTSPTGIVTDGTNVYWSEFNNPGTVRKVPVNGGTPTTLGYNVNNVGIAIDNGNVYWGENVFANSGKIDKASLSAGPTTNLATGLNNIWDVATDGLSVFWAENSANGAIRQVAINGGVVATIASNLASPVELDVDGANVYWIERGDGSAGTGTLKWAPKITTVQVSVGTNPPGLSFQVDGTTYTSAQTFTWLQGSSHTIATTVTQAGGAGTQYSWNAWTDNGALAHTIIADFNATFTGNFRTQYYLTTSATQGGTIAPSSAWYDAGTTVPISATPSSGYNFSGFSGDLTGPTTPQNLTMNSAHTVSASFAAAVYTISGTITEAGAPLASVTIALTGSTTASTTTDSNGNYSFSGLTSGGTFTLAPSRTGFTFSPANQTYTNLGANQMANFTATRITFSISGAVMQGTTALSGVSVALSGATNGTTTTDATGKYAFSGLTFGGNYTLTPSRPGYTFAPANQSFTNLGANTTANFSATQNTYTIGGRVSAGATGLSGVTVTLSGTTTGSTTTDTNGNYSFPGLTFGGNYTITPARSGYTFTPPNQAVTNISANQTANFAATLLTYTISGKISLSSAGLGGVTVTLTGTTTTSTTTDASGNYTFPGLMFGGNYTATPSKVGYTFAPGSLTFSNLGGNQTANFTATLLTFTVNGRVTLNNGTLAGVTITLTGSTTSTTTTDTNGNFSFSGLAYGGNFTITPSLKNYTFTPTNQSLTNLTNNQTISFTAKHGK